MFSPHDDSTCGGGNDPNCAGKDESITTPDSAGDVGVSAAIVLDASGNPVVSYWDSAGMDLKVMHCNDPACSGSDEIIAVPDSAGYFSLSAPMVLDASGNPVVVYRDDTNSELRVLHCGDPNCKGPAPLAAPSPSCTVLA